MHSQKEIFQLVARALEWLCYNCTVRSRSSCSTGNKLESSRGNNISGLFLPQHQYVLKKWLHVLRSIFWMEFTQ